MGKIYRTVSFPLCKVLLLIGLLPAFFTHMRADTFTSIPMAENSSEITVAAGQEAALPDSAARMEMIYVRGGCFLMGDSFGDGAEDEKPVHEVCVDGFTMGKFPVTVGQFRQFVEATGYRTDAENGGGCFSPGQDGHWAWRFLANWMNPGFKQGENHPVVCISWNDALEFTRWLTEITGKPYRLPSEAEWEYAARAGSTGRNYWGDDEAEACRYANVSDLTAKRSLSRKKVHNCDDGYIYTAPVGSYLPNDFGLHDMMGNVWQWTGDWYGAKYYHDSPRDNPQGPAAGKQHVPRGGSWRSKPEYVRASMRVHPPASQTAGVGFRLVTSFSAPAAVPVPQTGQTSCYKTTGNFGVIDCTETGQDGELRTGIKWPDFRFQAKEDMTITDTLTGLIWSKNADVAGGPATWRQALDTVNTLNRNNHLGHNDWRLPNTNELKSLLNHGTDPAAWLQEQGFVNVRADYYWTSTSYAPYPSHAWVVFMHGGLVAGRNKQDPAFIWPVRAGDKGSIKLARTGQALCYSDSGTNIPCAGTGQDGDLQKGVAWPEPRFSENDDRTLTDNLTGLAWSRDARTPGPEACAPRMDKTHRQVLDYIQCLNTNRFLGRSNWRLPNRNEMASLINRGKEDNGNWLEKAGFNLNGSARYWTSTSYASATWNAWNINIRDGAMVPIAKKIESGVWPVCPATDKEQDP